MRHIDIESPPQLRQLHNNRSRAMPTLAWACPVEAIPTCPLQRGHGTQERNPSLDRSSLRPAFTVIEMLTTVAVLIIVLGLMVSLARYVRNLSAVEVSKDLLHQLDALMQQYMARHEGHWPTITPLAPPGGRLPQAALLQR